MKPFFLILLVCFLAAPASRASAAMDAKDRVRIAEAKRLFDHIGERIWPGWGDAPFAILLVTPDKEFLVNHDAPDASFENTGYDSLLDSHIYVRDRVYSPGLLATFPAVGGTACIVIGQPKNTNASHSTRWVVTLLHEHFHQYQQSRPVYYTATNALGLAGADTTGMWMLNYPFPYDSKEVGEAFETLCRRLREAVLARDDASFVDKFTAYQRARTQFKNMLSAPDYSYFSFQVWQEGLARYTEYKVARLAGLAYTPSEQFAGLRDVVGFDRDAKQIRDHMISKLLTMRLADAKRTAFYQVGAAEGMILDYIYPQWRKHYFEKKFFIEEYVKLAPKRGWLR